MSTPQVWTRQGARELDRAAAAQAAALADRERARADEERALAQLRVAQARAEVAEQVAVRRAERRALARAERRAARRRVWDEHRALAAVLPMMGLSAAVAIPAQFTSYQRLTGDPWSAGVIAAMVEGGTWLGAALESAAHSKGRPVGRFRALTWGLASVAAAVNVQHGLAPAGGGHQGRWDVAAVLAAASLLGPLCWAAYAHLRAHHDHAAVGVRGKALRLLRYPHLSWQAFSLRAGFGVRLSPEAAWAHVWASHYREEFPQGLAPIEPTTPPIEPARTVQAIDPVPVEPAPVEPVECAPVELVEPVGPAPVEPAPVEPVESAPVELVEPVGPAPVEPAPVEPVEPVGPAPVEPVEPAPVESVDSTPVEPVEPAPVEPVEPAPVEPVEPAPVEPVEPAPVEPVEPARVQRSSRGRSGRSDEEIAAEIVASIAAGRLPAQPSAEAVRVALGTSWGRADRVLRSMEATTPTERVEPALVEPVESAPAEVVEPVESAPVDQAGSVGPVEAAQLRLAGAA